MSEATPETRGAMPGEPLHPQPATPVTPESPKRRSDLTMRLLTASILVPLVIYAIYLGGLYYLGVVTAVILLGMREIYGLIEDKGAHPLMGFGLMAGAALPVVAYIGTEYHATLLMTATLLAVMVLQLGKPQITEAMASISGTFFGVFYVGWLMSHAVPLRFFDESVAARYGPNAPEALGIVPDAGIFLMIFTLWAVVWSDAGAYFAGRAYGRRKLAPKISPGKTIEGAVGGVLGGLIGGLAAKGLFEFFWPDLCSLLGWTPAAIFATVIAVVAILGDLVESLLKRDAQRKDAGKLLPGMGGVLDRIDSPLLAIPIMYYMLLAYVFVRTVST